MEMLEDSKDDNETYQQCEDYKVYNKLEQCPITYGCLSRDSNDITTKPYRDITRGATRGVTFHGHCYRTCSRTTECQVAWVNAKSTCRNTDNYAYLGWLYDGNTIYA